MGKEIMGTGCHPMAEFRRARSFDGSMPRFSPEPCNPVARKKRERVSEQRWVRLVSDVMHPREPSVNVHRDGRSRGATERIRFEGGGDVGNATRRRWAPSSFTESFFRSARRVI